MISYHIADLKRQNRLKVGTEKPKLSLKVKMQSVSDDNDVLIGVHGASLLCHNVYRCTIVLYSIDTQDAGWKPMSISGTVREVCRLRGLQLALPYPTLV